jgi:DNA repair exonuclease SbcCD ATPase subunit
VADSDRIRAAADQLYAADPAQFTDQRADLVAQARAAGDKDAARAIGALRRPTRAAWVVNRLARADPAAVGRLTELGDQLRAAESALDGNQLRELSRTRRDLLAELTRQALAGADVADGPDALQQEVTGTLGAALADPGVAAAVAAGQLVKSVQPGGFGFGQTGDDHHIEGLVTRSGPGPGPRPSRGDRKQPSGRKTPAGEQRKAERERADRERAERARVELERQRQAISEAEQTLAEADQAVDAAHTAEEDREHTVRRLETQLEDAQDALADAKRRSREARTAQRQARKALERLRDRANQLPVTAVYRAGLDHGRLADPDGRARAPR